MLKELHLAGAAISVTLLTLPQYHTTRTQIPIRRLPPLSLAELSFMNCYQIPQFGGTPVP